MALSQEAINQAFADEGDTPWLALVTIDHPGLDAPIRVVANDEDVISRGMSFIALPFSFVLPSENGQLPMVKLEIDNVDRSIIRTIRETSGIPLVDIEIVLASQPDHVEKALRFMELQRAEYDAQKITGDVMVQTRYADVFPAEQYTSRTTPGLAR